MYPTRIGETAMNELPPECFPDDVPTSHPDAPELEDEHESEPRVSPRIYVTAGLPLRADLVVGTWLDMARPPRDIYADLFAAINDETCIDHDRVYIWDDNGFGAFEVITGPLGLEGGHSIDLLSTVARGIVEHGPAFAVWAQVHEDEPQHFDRFAQVFKGHYPTPGAFIRKQLEPMGYETLLDNTLPANIRAHTAIDYDAIAEHLFETEDIVAIRAGDGFWIFDERAG